MSKQRGHKQHEFEDIDDVVDYVSNLPDCIIHHILSFMPTKEVVKTSVLSTRWKNLWASVPNIDFDDELLDGGDVNDVASFVKFVERVLRLRDASNMDKFRLACRGYLNSSQIYSCISYAIMHNVQELDLYLLTDDPSEIPQSMFDNTSVVSLKIRVDHAMQLPFHVSFPCLKTLHLYFIMFRNDDFAEKLLSGCPVLENLVLYDCQWLDLENIVISSSTLKSLTIRDGTSFSIPNDYHSVCKMKIDAENLTYFEYTGYLLNEFLLNNVSSSLVKACINICPLSHPVWQKEVACRGVDLLKRLKNVESLSLSNDTMKSLIICTDYIPLHFPTFPNLIHLVLTTVIKSYAFRALMDMLYFCPNLQSMSLHEVEGSFEGFRLCIDHGENDKMWLLTPICVSNCLKIVTFKNFHANDSEICFLKRVLKYARVLERMNICWSKKQPHDINKRTKVRKELETVERSSTACVVKFS